MIVTLFALAETGYWHAISDQAMNIKVLYN
ncbi:hypothetical protein DT23_16725 [Thioclava indica]|uniref:Uncharacterized protein n=1 Tax=Thioclava indica TaxID=1353528 RepID=A0A074JKK6_9RHOB|nr:hypothetical protein DT23_16725 [Thioclava indica]